MSAHLCGCTEPATCICWCHGAGSSVPEAARAAAGLGDALTEHQDRESRWAAALDTTPGDADVQAAMTLADAEVAAAVAEERATTGRRVEALEKALRSFADHGLNCDLTPTINCATAATTYEHFRSYLVRLDDHVRDAARAALASPGEET